ncbi:hypothetical protein [Tenacibaculum amylolyticum]|uniref:hypothetical protein n=1 Tax=Tenacibaculum amylolyticum TaxID=104269 RepID=UPI0038934CA9
MNWKQITIICMLLSCWVTNAQYTFDTYIAHKSLVNSIRISSDIIEGRTTFFEKQSEEKPLMFQKTKVRMGELNRIANNLSKYIEKTQKEINSERVLYDLIDQDAYRKIFFKSNGRLTASGLDLKRKIDSLYVQAKNVNVHALSQLENFYEGHFKTNGEYYNHDGEEISFFDRLFYDKSNYGMMMAMNYLMLDVKMYQLLYYGTIMSY